MQNCHSLTQKHIRETINFIFNAIISLVDGTIIRKYKIKGKICYIFSRTKPLKLSRVSNEGENYIELESFQFLLYFPVKIE